jgi:hypothetical protein
LQRADAFDAYGKDRRDRCLWQMSPR